MLTYHNTYNTRIETIVVKSFSDKASADERDLNDVWEPLPALLKQSTARPYTPNFASGLAYR
jgi:hypothetical protein